MGIFKKGMRAQHLCTSDVIVFYLVIVLAISLLHSSLTNNFIPTLAQNIDKLNSFL